MIKEFKGYKAKITFSKEFNIFFGELLDIDDLIVFQSDSFDKIETKFHNVVENYIQNNNI